MAYFCVYVRYIGERREGPLSRFFLSFNTSLRVFWEFFTGFLFIHRFEKAVSFFGSAREMLPEAYYTDCEELAARLSRKGFAVITGGGGGIMRSANKGAKRVGGESVGINIQLPNEQSLNVFLTHTQTFSYFFSRKTILSCMSEVYVFFPGGYARLMSYLRCSPWFRRGTANRR